MITHKANSQAVIQSLGVMADEFLLNSILLKSIAPESRALPFLQAHTLELVAKCALIKIEDELHKRFITHGVKGIFERISLKKPEFKNLIPSTHAFENYRSVYIYDTGGPQTITLPSMDILEEYELAFLFENLPDLKYGSARSFELVSSIHISSPQVNKKLQKLVSATRAVYADEALNSAAIKNGKKVFENDRKTLSELHSFLGVY